MKRAGEFEWIAQYLAPLASDDAFLLKDDAALLHPNPELDLVITQDAVLEGIHFLPGDPADRIAQKALRVNLSDLAAKGAKPFSYSLALGVPDRWGDDDMASFAKGLKEDQQRYNIALSGGDTFRSPERLSVAITALGQVSPGGYTKRDGASPGDVLVVSGTIGDAALGLRVLSGDINVEKDDLPPLRDAYQLPNPPVSLAPHVAHHATASMDISDGLLGDCRKLCMASGVSATINRNQIPLSDAAGRLVARDDKHWKTVLTGGDDYQILCTVKEKDWNKFQTDAAKADIAVSQIGSITSKKNEHVALDIDGREVSIEDDSYSHF